MLHWLVTCGKFAWAGPNTVLGLIGAWLALGEGERGVWVDGVFEVCAPRLLELLSRGAPVNGGIRAITLGHVVLGTDAEALIATRRHERVHVRQYERWGPLFLPTYLACSGWQWMRGRHPYLDNPFEIEAYRVEGLPL